MTTANVITMGRLGLIPLFVVALEYHRHTGMEWARWAALVSFGLAAVLDGVDGWVARRYQQMTELGALLDPMADKLLLVSALVLLTWSESRLPHLPPFLLGLALLRDLLLTVGFIGLRWMTGGPQVRPHWSGKLATVCQMATVMWTLAAQSRSGQWILAVAASALTVVSGLWYLGQGIQQGRDSAHHRRSGPWLVAPQPKKRV